MIKKKDRVSLSRHFRCSFRLTFHLFGRIPRLLLRRLTSLNSQVNFESMPARGLSRQAEPDHCDDPVLRAVGSQPVEGWFTSIQPTAERALVQRCGGCPLQDCQEDMQDDAHLFQKPMNNEDSI